MLTRCVSSLGVLVLALACNPNEPGAEMPDEAGPPAINEPIAKGAVPYLEVCGHITDLIKIDLSQRNTLLADEQASALTNKCVADLADERKTVGEQMSLARVDCMMQAEQVEALLTCDLGTAKPDGGAEHLGVGGIMPAPNVGVARL